MFSRKEMFIFFTFYKMCLKMFILEYIIYTHLICKRIGGNVFYYYLRVFSLDKFDRDETVKSINSELFKLKSFIM